MRIEVGTVRLLVDDTGAGDTTVLLIHGWLGDHRTWSGLVPALSETCRVVAVDLRGHGASSVPERGYALTDMAADVAGVIRGLELGPVVLLAHSMGTTVATRLAISEPELVTALVLVDPDYGGDLAERPELAAIVDRADDAAIKADVVELFRNSIDAATESAVLREKHLDGVLASPALVVAQTLRAIIDRSASIRFRPEAEALLPARRQPVLSFHRIAERAEWERRQATHPASEVVIVPAAGHWIHEEQPEFVVAHLTAWLEKLGTPAGYTPTLSADHAEQIRRWHEEAYRRGKQESGAAQPISYLGRTFVIPPEVMPITAVSHLLGEAVLAEVRESDRVLDMGTGSGVNAILAASRASDVLAVDINPHALDAARRNAERNGVADRIEIRQSDVFRDVEGLFDLIVFDPPFRWFAPRDHLEAAMTDENYRAMTEFFRTARRYLTPTGRMLIFFGTSGDLGYLRNLAEETGFRAEVIAQDGTERDGWAVDYFTFLMTQSDRSQSSR